MVLKFKYFFKLLFIININNIMNKNIKPYVPILNFPLKLACVYSNYSSNLLKGLILWPTKET